MPNILMLVSGAAKNECADRYLRPVN